MDETVQFNLPYGVRKIEFLLPASDHPQVIGPRLVDPAADPLALVYQAIDHPLGEIIPG